MGKHSDGCPDSGHSYGSGCDNDISGEGGSSCSLNNCPGCEKCRGRSCFIATAVYGDPMAFEVVTLRHFRDSVLKKTYLGRKFVALYYKVSPPIADWLRTKPNLSGVVRFVLNQLVKLIK